jgi:hypothetical protein
MPASPNTAEAGAADAAGIAVEETAAEEPQTPWRQPLRPVTTR